MFLIFFLPCCDRYGCDGQQQQNRTMYYFEYPSYVTMLLREIKYGIELTLGQVTIDPFIVPREDRAVYASFEYHMGNVDVSFCADRVVVVVPGSNCGVRTYKVTGLYANTLYKVTSEDKDSSTAAEYSTSSSGILTFAVTDNISNGGRLHVTIAAM